MHKAQGVTVDRAHVLAGPGMDRHAAYVALTRHREGVALHWSREAMGSREGLIRALSRERAKDTSLDYAGPEALARYAERRGLHPPGPGEGAGRVRTEPAREASPVPPLLPAFRDAWGRDSLGRGTTAGELHAAGEHDPRARQVREDREHWIGRAWRDPEAARVALAAVLAEEGGDLRRTAQRLHAAGPEALGKLRGREGLLSTPSMRIERDGARFAARVVVGSLEDEAGHRARAAEAWAAAVRAQRARDVVEVPGLSPAAWRALEGVARAREAADGRKQPGEDRHAAEARRDARVAVAWQRGRRGGVGEEIDRFLARALERLGEEGMRAALRAAPGGHPVEVAGTKPEQRADLARLARGIALGREGGRRHEAHRWRMAERQRERLAERERAASRQRLGLPPEEPRREQQQGRGMRM